MIVISGGDVSQIDPRMLSDLEWNIVRSKQASSNVYHYPSLDALLFELKMRTQIVEAAKAMYRSGVGFADFHNSRSNPQYWIRTQNGGFLLRPGVTPSAGIRDIYTQGYKYAFECAGAIIINLYKAVLETIGDRAFNYYFQNLYLRDWQHDSDLKLTYSYNNRDVYPGDVLYFRNPDVNPATPEWQGENVILLDRNLYYGHGVGIGTSEDIIAALNRARRPGSRRSAYLDNLVVRPDFEAIRMLTANVGQYG
ncbi:protein-glutamine gamma-glutamyltransferase [Paenibacillus yanchengensis]|uniref:Protein-glutamine gamma-glutamyltransferase n=1 Tax=Paenibacillus yanchengensis TaxID=2035833 RepID=A0ABW4YGB2_9BACL